jgi:PAS domain S-box-containing protein
LSSLRRFLIRLSLDTHTPASLLDAATQAISEMLGVRCAFLEGEVMPEPAPEHLAATVYSDGRPIGGLIVAKSSVRERGISDAALQELADLVGTGLINASQAQAVAELQVDSEDMLYYAPDAIMVLSRAGRVEMANQKALSFMGLTAESILGRMIQEALGAPHLNLDDCLDSALSGDAVEIETRGSAGTRLASLTFSHIGEEPGEKLLCIIRDITSERQAQLALRRIERSVLMGQAVAYLLHEVNNPLAALMTNLALAIRRNDALDTVSADRVSGTAADADDTRNGDGAKTRFGHILRNAEKAAVRIRETMAILRSVHVGEQPGDIQFIDVAYELRLAVSAAELETAGKAAVLSEIAVSKRVKAAPFVIAETIGALLKNALQAVENQPKGEILLWARESGSDVVISVDDNGSGVARDIADRIFMPFFTTKPLGEALGLGLSLAEDAARRMGGTLTLLPKSWPGARFELTLPISSE